MRVELLFPSKFIKEADLKGKQVTLTIRAVKVDTLTMVGGKKEKKPVVYFKETPKMWVLNKTNAMATAELLGRDTDAWIGKRLTLFPTKDRFQGKLVPCVRVYGSPDAIKDATPASDEPIDDSDFDSDTGEPQGDTLDGGNTDNEAAQ